MWPWSRPKPDPTLEARLDEVERALKRIDVEWSEWYDKYRRLYARLAKRAQEDADRHEDAPGTTTEAPGGVQANPLARRLLEGDRRGLLSRG